MIMTQQLQKHYGRVQALDGLEMDVPDGTIYGFIGQNGAGKTTTLRILAGLLVPDGGSAEVAGYDVVCNPRAVRNILGYMPDFFGVYDDLRVGEYLLFYAAAHGIRRQAAQKLRDDLLELVELADKRDEFVDSLSRGMQQRLCLARALIHDPQVLLLDEPASGLDPVARIEMREILKELRRLGKTILISSHILSELADLCTHIGMIADGRLVRQGPLLQMVEASQLQKIVLRCHGDAAPAVQALESWPGATVLQAVDGRIELQLAGGTQEAAALLKELVLAGAAVAHYSIQEHTLEDAFIQLARG